MTVVMTAASTRMWSLIIVLASLFAEILFGYRFGEVSGFAFEVLSMLSFIIVSVLLFSPSNHDRPLFALISSLIFMLVYGFLHANFTTFMDVKYGGAYGWSATRTIVLAAVVYPVVALFAAGVVYLAARLRMIRLKS